MKKMILALCLAAMGSTAFAADPAPATEKKDWTGDVFMQINVPPQPEGHRFGQLLVEITATETWACAEDRTVYERIIVAKEDEKNILYVVDNNQDQAYKGPFYVVPQPDAPGSASMRMCPEEDRDQKVERKIRFIVWHKALDKNIYLGIPKGTFKAESGEPKVTVGWGSMPLY